MVPAHDGLDLEGLKGWGGWGLFFLAIIWWIRGIPERRRAGNEADEALRKAYGEQIDRLQEAADKAVERMDRMEREHSADRTAWINERTALRDEHEADRRRWDAEREQWRKERTTLLDQVAGLERKLKSYGSSKMNIETEGVNAPEAAAKFSEAHP